MSDRPTPETDALDCELHTPRVLQDRYSEMRDHAQKLERERDEALMDRARGETATMTINHYERILRERDEAREVVSRIEEIFCDGEDTHDDWMKMGNIARDYLKGLE